MPQKQLDGTLIGTLEKKASVLRSISSYDELMEVHYVDRQYALTRWTVEIMSLGIWHL